MLMSHFHRRLKGIHDPKMTTAKYRRELELGQTKTEHFLVEKWKFIPKKGYGDTREWLPLALKVQSYFLHLFQSAEFLPGFGYWHGGSGSVWAASACVQTMLGRPHVNKLRA